MTAAFELCKQLPDIYLAGPVKNAVSHADHDHVRLVGIAADFYLNRALRKQGIDQKPVAGRCRRQGAKVCYCYMTVALGVIFQVGSVGDVFTDNRFTAGDYRFVFHDGLNRQNP